MGARNPHFEGPRSCDCTPEGGRGDPGSLEKALENEVATRYHLRNVIGWISVPGLTPHSLYQQCPEGSTDVQIANRASLKWKVRVCQCSWLIRNIYLVWMAGWSKHSYKQLWRHQLQLLLLAEGISACPPCPPLKQQALAGHKPRRGVAKSVQATHFKIWLYWQNKLQDICSCSNIRLSIWTPPSWYVLCMILEWQNC